MAVLLASEPELLLAHAKRMRAQGLAAILTDGESALAHALRMAVEDALVVDINGPSLSRVNFDVVALVILDLAPETLLSASGRRLTDALGRLAEDELTLGFCGPAVAVTGLLLEDGVTAGLNLVPHAVVIPDVQRVDDLQALLAGVSERGVRILALDTPVSARYEHAGDSVTVEGSGNVLLVSFLAGENGGRPTARLHALTNGMQDTWPA